MLILRVRNANETHRGVAVLKQVAQGRNSRVSQLVEHSPIIFDNGVAF